MNSLETTTTVNMKKVLVTLGMLLISIFGYSQQKLLSYEDIKYLLHNNLAKNDTFLITKGYSLEQKDIKKNNRKYTLSMPGSTKSELQLRADGKRINISLETNSYEQYNLLLNSISQFRVKDGNIGDVQTYDVKNLANIYITITDTVPYDAIKKDYDIEIVPYKNITAVD